MTIPFALSLSKGAVWFDKLATNGFLIAGYYTTKYQDTGRAWTQR